MSSVTTTFTLLGTTVLVNGILLIVLGLLAASSSIIGRRRNARSYIGALVPYQGALGLITCLWGIWVLFSGMPLLEQLTRAPWKEAPWQALPVAALYFTTDVLGGSLVIALGLLLAHPLLTKYWLNRNVEARSEHVQISPFPYQTTLGFLAIALGVWIVYVLQSLLVGGSVRVE